MALKQGMGAAVKAALAAPEAPPPVVAKTKGVIGLEAVDGRLAHLSQLEG